MDKTDLKIIPTVVHTPTKSAQTGLHRFAYFLWDMGQLVSLKALILLILLLGISHKMRPILQYMNHIIVVHFGEDFQLPSMLKLSLTLAVCLFLGGESGAAEAGWAGLSDSGPALRRLGRFQRPPGVLLFPKSLWSWKLCQEAMLPWQSLSHVAGKHWLRGQHPGSLLQRQLQTGHRHQVNDHSTCKQNYSGELGTNIKDVT